MKLIPLTLGKFAQVDDEDYDFLMQWKWWASKKKHTYYAISRIDNKEVVMHRIVNKTPDDLFCDHKDRDGLNNQSDNLRGCTTEQNLWNRKPHKTNKSTSQYKGVYLCHGKYWSSRISYSGKTIHLGHFKTEIEAAKAHDDAAKKHHGEFAYLNFN